MRKAIEITVWVECTDAQAVALAQAVETFALSASTVFDKDAESTHSVLTEGQQIAADELAIDAMASQVVGGCDVQNEDTQ